MSYLVLDIESFLRTDTKWKAPEDDPTMFSPLPCHGIASIGGLSLEIDDKANRCSWIGTFGESGDESHEYSRLKEFLHYYRKENPVIVTYNGRGFDIPLLWHRAMHFGLPIPEFFKKSFTYRFAQEDHFDLAEKITEYGSFHRPKLEYECEIIGLPGKTEVHGSQVHQIFRDREFAKIDSYVQCDVIEEAYLFLRYQHVCGEISAVTCNNLVYGIRSKALALENPMINDLFKKIDFSVLEIKESYEPAQRVTEEEAGIPF